MQDSAVTILAATERLARELRVRFALQKQREGARAWVAPAIHSYRGWIQRSWGSAWPTQQILFPAQELALWLYALEQSGHGEALLSRTAAARQARYAGNLLTKHQIDPEPGHFATRDEQIFAEWHALVQQNLGRDGWITEEQLPEALLKMLAAGDWVPEARLHLVGFVDETPLQRLFFGRLSAAGVQIERSDLLEPVESIVVALRPSTRLDQWRLAACRAKDVLAPFANRYDQAPPRIGILVPDPEQCRDQFEAVLREYLAPFTSIPGPLRSRLPWRFSRGRPLAEHPLVAAALDAISLDRFHNGLEVISRLILSPLTFTSSGSLDKSALEFRLRQRGGSRFSLRSIRRLCNEIRTKQGADATSFAAIFDQWLETFESSMPRLALPSDWVRWIESLLGAAGWGVGPMSAEQTQAVDDWRVALDALSSMDTQVGEIDQGRMVVWIREILLERTFQASGEHLQPVEVMAYWDAIGSQFDELLVLDLNANQMPEMARSTGYLPTERLAAAGVPNVTPESALERGKLWMAHIKRTAPKIIFMSPGQDDSGARTLPSPLHAGWPSEETGGPQCISHLESILRAGAKTSYPPPELVPPIAEPVKEGVRGGIAILKNMAVSPWVAFARHRLGLTEFPMPTDGLDHRVQGKLVHRALERFWREVRSQGRLLALTYVQRLDKVVGLVTAVQNEDGIASAAHYGEGMATVERERAVALIMDWLNLESKRAHPFEVVLCEEAMSVRVGPLGLDLRVDRVDRITDRSGTYYIVIDYKSGANVDTRGWDPEDLTEPQLPTYASFGNLAALGVPEIHGVAFAQVAEGDCAFHLLASFAGRLIPAADGDVGSGMAEWYSRVGEWAATLTRSAQEFMAGDLSLDRAKFKKNRFVRDLDPLVRPGPEPEALTPGVDPF